MITRLLIILLIMISVSCNTKDLPGQSRVQITDTEIISENEINKVIVEIEYQGNYQDIFRVKVNEELINSTRLSYETEQSQIEVKILNSIDESVLMSETITLNYWDTNIFVSYYNKTPQIHIVENNYPHKIQNKINFRVINLRGDQKPIDIYYINNGDDCSNISSESFPIYENLEVGSNDNYLVLDNVPGFLCITDINDFNSVGIITIDGNSYTTATAVSFFRYAGIGSMFYLSSYIYSDEFR